MGFRTRQTIRPRAAGAYVGGRWVDGPAAEPVTILASVQPASAGDYDRMQTMAEGRRIRAMVRIYTAAQLNVAGQDWRNGDRLVWERAPHPGEYLVVAVSAWQSGVIPHYRYLAVLQGEETA